MSNERIKILTIPTSGLSKRDGISTVVLDYLGRLDSSKYDMHVAATGKYSSILIEDYRKAGITVQFLPSRKRAPIQYVRSLSKLLTKENYDVIYVHGSSAILALDLMVAKQCGCRVRIAHCHNTTCTHKGIDWIMRPVFYKVITNGLACGDMAGRWLFGSHPFTVIHNGRDPEIYRYKSDVRRQMRDFLGIGDGILAVGHVGNFTAQKNHTFLIEVFKQLQAAYPQTRLFLMGEGPELDGIKELAAKREVNDYVSFMGSIQNVPDMLQAMDVMVLPSLHEGLPLVVVEWQMAGLPCVIADTITDESAFSRLVSFLSLDTAKKEWAETIIRVSKVNREEESLRAIEAARESGFDINADIDLLDEILSGGVENANI